MKRKAFASLLSLTIFAALLTGCANASAQEASPAAGEQAAASTETSPDGSSAAGEVRTITVAYDQAYVPYGYTDENGVATGFEIEVLRLVDELLEEYEFTYVGTSNEDLLIGTESGKYDLGVKGAWFTEERVDKFIFPQHYVAASSIGITFRTENASEITDLASFATFSGKLVPISPQNAQYAVVQDFNDNNPDNQIDLIAAESFDNGEAYTWVLEGRYDAFFDIKTSFEANVVAETGAFHSFADQLSYAVYRAIPTYPLFYKGNQDVADAYDTAMETLLAGDALVELQYEYFGEELFQYVVEE